MTTFRCKRSGNTIEVIEENDVIRMRELSSYEEVKDDAEDNQVDDAQKKRRGRPPRVIN